METTNFQTANSLAGRGIDQVINHAVVAIGVHGAAYITDFRLGHSSRSGLTRPGFFGN